MFFKMGSRFTLISIVYLFLLLNIVSSQEIIKRIRIQNFIEEPKSFSLDIEGNIYILDSENNKLIKLNSKGNLIKSIEGWGWGHLNFDKPISVDASDGLNIFISDYYNHRILRYNRELEHISTLFTRDTDDMNSRFGFPTAVAVDHFFNLFIYDNENKRVLKFDKKNNISRSFGGYESAAAQIRDPLKICIDQADNVYIAETNRINIFNNWGNLINVLKCNDGFTISSFSIASNQLIITDSRSLIIMDFGGKVFKKIDLLDNLIIPQPRNILDMNYYNNKLYVLIPEEILIVTKIVN